MDRISGLLPQIGWSPVLAVPAPKKAPATTVEPAAGAGRADGGMGAEVGAQPGGARGGKPPAPGAPEGETARIGPPPDPDAPTGPPPSFEMTYLEARAARWRADPSTAGASDGAPAGDAAPATAEEKAATADRQGKAGGHREETAPALDPPASPSPRAGWPALAEPPEPSLDLTR